jgi:hypothetical protein
MSAQPQAQPQPVFKASATFQDVISKNPDFPTWSPEDKNSLADMFFREKYSDMAPEDYDTARLTFNKKYNVGQEQANPLDVGNLATLGLPARAWDAATGGVGGAADIRDAQMNRFATDPGLYGDLYRLSQNDITKTLGSLGGAVVGAEQTAANIAPGILSKVPFLGNVLKRLAPETQRAIATAGVFSGKSNLGGVLTGQQTVPEAVANTAFQTATGGLMGGSRLKNAGVQGGIGYGQDALSSILADVASGRPIDFNRANQQGMHGGVTGAGLGLAFDGGTHTVPEPPRTLQGRVLRQEIPVERFGRPTQRAEADYQQRISNEATTLIQLRNRGMVKEANLVLKALRPETQARIQAEVKAFDERNTARQTVNSQRIKTAVQQLGPDPARRQQNNQLREAIQTRAAQERRQYEADFKRLVEEEKALTRQHKEAIARHKSLQAQAEKIRNLKQKQAIRDRIVYEKAEGQKRAGELRRLRQEIKSRTAEKTSTEGTPKPSESTNSRQQDYKQRREDVLLKIRTLYHGNSATAEQPAIDILSKYYDRTQIKLDGSDPRGGGRRLTVGGRFGESGGPVIRFRVNDTIGSLLKKYKMLDQLLAGRIVRQDAEHTLHDDLVSRADSISHDDFQQNSHETHLLDAEGSKIVDEHEAAFNRLAQDADALLAKIRNAKTFDEMEEYVGQLESPAYAYLPKEVLQDDIQSAVNEGIRKLSGGSDESGSAPAGDQISQRGDQEREAGATKPSSVKQARATLEQAIQQGKAVILEHRAEKAGTRDDSTYRQKLDLPYEFGTNEKGEFVRVINENGQVSMRYLHDVHGQVEISNERHPYTFDREGVYKAGGKKGETGRFRVLDEDGNEVSQVKTNLTKDSELAKRLQQMEAIVTKVKKGGQKPSVREILEASSPLSEKEFNESIKGLSDEKIDEIAKDFGC